MLAEANEQKIDLMSQIRLFKYHWNAHSVPKPPYVPGYNCTPEDQEMSRRLFTENRLDKRLFVMMKDCGIQMVYLALLVILVAANRGSISYYQNSVLSNSLSVSPNVGVLVLITKRCR